MLHIYTSTNQAVRPLFVMPKAVSGLPKPAQPLSYWQSVQTLIMPVKTISLRIMPTQPMVAGLGLIVIGFKDTGGKLGSPDKLSGVS